MCAHMYIMRKVFGVCALAGCKQKVPVHDLAAQAFPVAGTEKCIVYR